MPPDPPSAPRFPPVREWAERDRRLLHATLALAIVLRVVCWQGVSYHDSLNYAEQSVRILAEGPSAGLVFHQQNRLGMTLPPAVFAALLGASEVTLVLPFLVLSAVEAWFVPRLLARILPAPGAIAASALYLLAPQTVRGATAAAADNAMAAWANLGILAILAAPAEGRLRAAAVGGALLGVANLHKESVVVLLPVAAAAVLVGAPPGGRLRALLAFGAGFGGVLVAEAAAFLAWTGEPFHRYTGIAHTHGEMGLPDWDVATRAAVTFRQWPGNLLGTPSTAGALLFVLPVALLALRSREPWGPGTGIVAAWLLFAGLWTVFGTSTPSAWRPLLPYPRYLQFVALPAAILAGRFLTEPGLRPRGRVAGLASVLLPVAMAAVAAAASGASIESLLAAAAGVALIVLARRGEVRAAVAVGIVALGSVGPVVSRATGIDVAGGVAEREALEWARKQGQTDLCAAGPAYHRIAFLLRLDPSPGIRVARYDADAAARGEPFVLRARDDAPGGGATPHGPLLERARFPADGSAALRILAPAR